MSPRRFTSAGRARPTPTRAARKNRRRRGSLRARLPEGRAVRATISRSARRAMPTLIVAAALVAVAGVGWGMYTFVTRSDRFAVEQVEVRGAHTVSEAYVRALLVSDPGDGRVRGPEGDSIFGIELERLEARLERSPWIADASLRRQLPRALVVEIVEHQAAALVEAGGLYLADLHGRIFKRASIARGEGVGLPVVTGLTRDELRADPKAASARVRQALTVLAAYRTGRDRPRIGEIRLDARRGATLITHDTATAVRLGSGPPQVIADRLDAFDTAWAALDDDERALADTVFANNATRPDRVTVALRSK